jgi:hypothetical protein
MLDLITQIHNENNSKRLQKTLGGNPPMQTLRGY